MFTKLLLARSRNALAPTSYVSMMCASTSYSYSVGCLGGPSTTPWFGSARYFKTKSGTSYRQTSSPGLSQIRPFALHFEMPRPLRVKRPKLGNLKPLPRPLGQYRAEQLRPTTSAPSALSAFQVRRQSTWPGAKPWADAAKLFTVIALGSGLRPSETIRLARFVGRYGKHPDPRQLPQPPVKATLI